MSLKSPGLLLTGLVLKVSIFAKKSLKDTGKNTTRIEKKKTADWSGTVVVNTGSRTKISGQVLPWVLVWLFSPL